MPPGTPSDQNPKSSLKDDALPEYESQAAASRPSETLSPRRSALGVVGKGVTAVGRSVRRNISSVVTRMMLRVIEKELQKGLVQRQTIEDILDLQRPGLYAIEVNKAAWNFLMVALQRLRVEQMSMLVDVALKIPRWKKKDVQILVLQLYRCDRSNWSQYPQRTADETRYTNNRSDHPWPCEMLRTRQRRIILEVLRVDPTILHEVLNFDQFSAVLCSSSCMTTSSRQPSKTFSSSLDRVLFASITEEDFSPRGTPYGVIIECAAVFVNTSNDTDLLVGAVSHVLKVLGYFAAVGCPTLPPDITLHPAVPFLWLASRLCTDNETSVSLMLEGDIITTIARLWASPYLGITQREKGTNISTPSTRLTDLYTACLQLLSVFLPYHSLEDILMELCRLLDPSHLLKFDFDGICARPQVLLSPVTLVALSIMKRVLSVVDLDSTIPKAAYHLIFSVLAQPTQGGSHMVDESKQLAVDIVLLTAVLPQSQQDPFIQYCTVHGQAFQQDHLHVELRDVMHMLTKLDYANRNITFMRGLYSLATARRFKILNPIDRFAQLCAPVALEAQVQARKMSPGEVCLVAERWKDVVEMLNQGAFDFVAGTQAQVSPEEVLSRRRLMQQLRDV
ncbi:hypothetical protein BXZ70DRAFT_1007273 [Cristinia sonorae]|uniref:Uncharacterized protein n=1 Tax=Cristinia sonorae TaxID=1940300 RepID=A0A8K0UQV9_9AGAR|nr:hypothetical protein BXZ70DRAFT_1007273 [Cristinia sonorae]